MCIDGLAGTAVDYGCFAPGGSFYRSICQKKD